MPSGFAKLASETIYEGQALLRDEGQELRARSMADSGWAALTGETPARDGRSASSARESAPPAAIRSGSRMATSRVAAMPRVVSLPTIPSDRPARQQAPRERYNGHTASAPAPLKLPQLDAGRRSRFTSSFPTPDDETVSDRRQRAAQKVGAIGPPLERLLRYNHPLPFTPPAPNPVPVTML